MEKVVLVRPAANKSYVISFSDIADMVELASTCPAMRDALEKAKVIYALAGSPKFHEDEYDEYDEYDESIDCSDGDDEWD